MEEIKPKTKKRTRPGQRRVFIWLDEKLLHAAQKEVKKWPYPIFLPHWIMVAMREKLERDVPDLHLKPPETLDDFLKGGLS